jgi:biotin operon repressor
MSSMQIASGPPLVGVGIEVKPTASNREVVKQYLLEHPDRVAEDTQEAIAQDLGVARATVTRAVESLREDGKLVQVNELSTDEKRQQAREC